MIDFLKNRKVQIAAQAVVITGLVGGTGAVVTMNKPVTLEVNGQAEEIRTFGGTVGDILDSHEIDVDKITVKNTKGHTDTIKIGDGTVVKMRYPGIEFFVEGVPLNTIVNRIDVAAQCIEQIAVGEEVYNREDMNEGDAQEWLEGLTSTQFNQVMEFFQTMPRLSHTFKLTNKNTGNPFSITLEGLADFF